MDDSADLPTSLWVDAGLRHCTAQGIGAFVVNKGSYAGGSVVLKLNTLDGLARVLIQTRSLEGRPGWMDIFDEREVDESRADAYIQRSVDRDPDLWVIEIESKDQYNPYGGDIF